MRMTLAADQDARRSGTFRRFGLRGSRYASQPHEPSPASPNVFLRTGAKYAAVVSQDDERAEHLPHGRAGAAVRDVIERGIRNADLRADLPHGAFFAMIDALIGHALLLAVTEQMAPE
jgi:hypothetical protein